MPNKTESTTQPLNAWLAQELRLTAFYSQGQEFDMSEWWAELAGGSPEKEVKDLKTATTTVEGPSGKGSLVLEKNPLVVNLRYRVETVGSHVINGIPTVGSFEEACEHFVGLSKKLLSIGSFRRVTRLAFGATLNRPADSLEQALAKLVPYLKNVSIDPANSKDLVYRINRRKPSTGGIDGLYINRLNTWSTVSYLNLATSTLPETPPSASQLQHASQLELDINTPQDFAGDLPFDKLETIFDELVEMGVEIAREGDVS